MDEEYKNYYRLRNKLSIIDENIKNVKGKILEIETYTKKGSLLDKLIKIKDKVDIYNFKNFFILFFNAYIGKFAIFNHNFTFNRTYHKFFEF